MTAGPGRLLRVILGPKGPPIVPQIGWSAWLTTLASLAMAFLAVLAVAAALAADRLGSTWEADLAGAATVRVPGLGEGADRALEAVLDVLRTTPRVVSAAPLSDAEQRALLEPWFGAEVPMADLPVPQLVAVTVERPGPDPAGLQNRLNEVVPGAIYDDHSGWRDPLTETATGLRRLAMVATLAIVAAAGAMIALAARATLAGNADVVRTVRLVGGEDSFIAGAFIRRITSRAFFGAAAGAGLGLLLLSQLPDLVADGILGTPLLPGGLGPLWIGGAVAFGAALIAFGTARIAIGLALRQIL